jgi:hypothetical protein
MEQGPLSVETHTHQALDDRWFDYLQQMSAHEKKIPEVP